MRSAKAVVSEKLARLGHPVSSMSHTTMATHRPPSHTVTSLKRWSVLNKELPAVSQIRAIHVYDFDNTLFLSPLPNPQLWNGGTIGFLQAFESFVNGGWWHDSNILAATGDGMEKEEPRAWNGWWNEQILRLVRLSMEQKDALTVLLTGRSEAGFAEIIKRMTATQKLDFDLVGLKPEVGPNGERFASTMNFKQTFLGDLVYTYELAEELRVYEDRPKHVAGFRDFFETMNRNLQAGEGPVSRSPINAEVIQVSEECAYLDPVTEAAEVQRMINSHNIAQRNLSQAKSKSPYGRLRIKRTTYYTGYLLSQADSNRLVQDLLVPLLPPGLTESNTLRYMANSIVISPRPAPKSILEKIGGIGTQLSWQVTGTGCFENRIWAARVSPIPSTATYYSENPTPVVVLAVRKGSRPVDAGRIQNWHPVPAGAGIRFDTVVGEKVVLRVEEDNLREGEWESKFVNKNHKRRHPETDEDVVYPQSSQNAGYEGQSQGYQSQSYQSQKSFGGNFHDDGARRGSYRGGRGRGMGRGRGGRGGRGRGRGRDTQSNSYYRSLDDTAGSLDGASGDRGGNEGGGFTMNY